MVLTHLPLEFRPEILTKDAVLESSRLGTAHGLLYRNRLRSIAFAIAS
jgi:hypothetical protein